MTNAFCLKDGGGEGGESCGYGNSALFYLFICYTFLGIGNSP